MALNPGNEVIIHQFHAWVPLSFRTAIKTCHEQRRNKLWQSLQLIVRTIRNQRYQACRNVTYNSDETTLSQVFMF